MKPGMEPIAGFKPPKKKHYPYRCVCDTHTHTHIYIYIYTHTHIYIYIYIYPPAPAGRGHQAVGDVVLVSFPPLYVPPSAPKPEQLKTESAVFLQRIAGSNSQQQPAAARTSQQQPTLPSSQQQPAAASSRQQQPAGQVPARTPGREFYWGSFWDHFGLIHGSKIV